jgi:hypothetical protein
MSAASVAAKVKRLQKLQADNQAQQQLQTSIDLASLCFKQQQDFATCTAKFSMALCSRRAGKTYASALMLLNAALECPESAEVYIAPTQRTARRIFFPTLCRLNKNLSLGGVVNETSMSIAFPNGSVIYLLGARDEDRITDVLGLAIKKVVVDECQSISRLITPIIEALTPALLDYDGSLSLIGTPGAVPAGTFFDLWDKKNGFAKFHWTCFDNPHMLQKARGKTIAEQMAEECSVRGITEAHPSIQRGYYGLWALDRDSLMFHWDGEKNSYESLPPLNHFVIGGDLGWRDADALVVLGWNDSSESVYLVEEEVTTKQTLSVLTDKLQAMVDRYQPQAIVFDMGGLGRKLAESIMERSSLYLEAAEKSRKFEHIAILNDALESGTFKAGADSRFVGDSLKLEKEFDAKSEKYVESGEHSDVCDAILYAYRKCQAFRHEADVAVDSDPILEALLAPPQLNPEAGADWTFAND